MNVLKIIFLAVFVVGGAQSAQAYCGGEVVQDQDCSSNPRAYAESCCPAGFRVQGIAYNDMGKRNSAKQKDVADAISVICRSLTEGNELMPSDFQTPPITLMCDKTEVFAGIACKDLENEDELDGCTAICQKPGSQEVRKLYNPDLLTNPRPYVEHMVYLPKRVVGLVYKDMTRNSGSTNSDEADCVNISVQ